MRALSKLIRHIIMKRREAQKEKPMTIMEYCDYAIEQAERVIDEEIIRALEYKEGTSDAG